MHRPFLVDRFAYELREHGHPYIRLPIKQTMKGVSKA